ncbi:hypothetical protein M406DRAFT_347946 [Cryphonectria parasitica EP155]|uniref:Bactericidal permeability-increasing protein n=1 Tax=Cryphonectria parasitica (strain ATCC 38755 / EP155) TaxID=660469 RepID=A0A9P4XVB1_CRYP1|nr:uncharacterized protein M406DRAFT_347946 [Cryphonectria parasitica EP155]KAF3761639.1 hypothetical protein M406DRAFT_347946 [Cryphonectria parasitica EP155]
MASIMECLEDEDREPLLPQYLDDTVLQRELHQKLHTYQMLRALTQGSMPSNEQAIINLRTLLASDVLNVDNAELSDSGRALIHYTKLWLKQFMDLLQHKNGNDQIQDFIWYLTKARVSVDMEDIVHRTSKATSKAQTAAAYQSLQTVGSLLLTNSDFRLFLADLSTIGREVFRDTAFTLSEVSQQAAHRLEPSKQQQQALREPGTDGETVPSAGELGGDVTDVAKVVVEGAAEVAQEAEHSFVEKITGDEKTTLLYRLKEAVTKLRKRQDYSESVSTIAKLLQRYALVYSHVVQETASVAERDIDTNSEMDKAVKNFWAFVKSFGDSAEWQELERRFNQVLDHGKIDPQFDKLVQQAGNALQEMLTDPGFFEHAEQRFQDLRAQSSQLASDSSLRDDIDGLLAKLQSTIKSVLRDVDISKLMQTSTYIAKILSPAHQYTNTELVTDAMHHFIPKLIESIQYVPIPRVEVSTPEVDLLLENIILEPGVTINSTSFLPYRLRVETRNDLEIRKARTRTTSSLESLVTVKVDGMSIRAQEIGYWIRAHSGLLQLADEGIASFELDERGIDVEIDIEVAKERMESIISLKAVRVHIHKLDYTLRKSKFALAATLFKPMIIPMVRSAIESQMSTAIADLVHFANRELLYARERLRATRIADPDDLWTFIKAVSARLVPEEDPDLYTRVGITAPGSGVFKGVYAPGSIVKVWNEEAIQAMQRIREGEDVGWRNDIFDVVTSHL